MDREAAMIALVDVNNFYVARSAEVKALGINMGAPWHQLLDFAEQESIIARSSNYALYADMSHRVMTILNRFSLNQVNRTGFRGGCLV
jgi:DNA polymerase V